MRKLNLPKKYLLTLLLCCMMFYSWGGQIILDSLGDGKLEAKAEVTVYFDASGATHPRQLSLENFSPLSSLSDTVFYPKDAKQTWFYLEIKNTTNHSIDSYFYLGEFDMAHAYIQSGEKWIKQTNGWLVKKKERAHIFESIFPIQMAPQSEVKLFLHLEDSFEKDDLEFQIFSKHQLYAAPPLSVRMPMNFALMNVFFFGILLFVIVFSIIQYFQVRELSYIFYAGYLLSMCFFYLIRFEMWYPEFSLFFSYFVPHLHHFEVGISLFIYITYTLFIVYFLDLKKISPKDYRRLMWMIYGYLIYLVVDKLIWAVGGISWSMTIFTIFRAVMLPIGLVYVGYLMYRFWSKLAAYVLVGSLFLIIGAAVGLVMTILAGGGSEVRGMWTFPIFYVMLGVIGEIVFFSAGLGYKNRLEVENKNKALLKAMRSQMNPHFIFNGLNSIKQLIYEKNDRSAIRYLTRFSKLFRKVLSNSDKDLITLGEELEMCKVFLQIESLRFKDKFEYEIILDENVDLGMVDIPPMTIQPHLENAIWHGLLPKENDCKLDIIIENKGSFVRCLIDDNGIGRAASKDFKRQTATKKESFGIKLSTERLRYNNISLEIIDKKDATGKSLGTQVEILIPA